MSVVIQTLKMCMRMHMSQMYRSPCDLGYCTTLRLTDIDKNSGILPKIGAMVTLYVGPVRVDTIFVFFHKCVNNVTGQYDPRKVTLRGPYTMSRYRKDTVRISYGLSKISHGVR